MEAIKAKTAKGEHHDVDDTLLKSKAGILGKFCVIADCEHNIPCGQSNCTSLVSQDLNEQVPMGGRGFDSEKIAGNWLFLVLNLTGLGGYGLSELNPWRTLV